MRSVEVLENDNVLENESMITDIPRGKRQKINLMIAKYGRLISITASTQAAIQVVGLICSLLIIRNFSLREYAFYTLANTILGAMNILADGGIVSGVLAQGGKVWNDKERLGSVVATGLNLRIQFAIGSILIGGIILVLLLIKSDSHWFYSLIILLSIFPVFYANLSDSMLEVGPKLHQAITPLQKNQLIANILRLVCTCSIFWFPFAPVALLAAGIPRIFMNIELRRTAYKYYEVTAKIDNEVRENILKLVKRILPGEIYNIFSVQITIWVLSFVGSANSIAQVGALFRFGAILTLLSIIVNTVLLPRYCRLKDEKSILINRMVKTQLFIVALSLSIVIFSNMFSKEIIWMLGDNYAGLENELVLTIIVFCLNFIGNAIYSLCRGRGWVINPLLTISINLMTIIGGAFLFDLSTLYGVLLFNILTSAIVVITHSAYSFIKLFLLNKRDLNG